MDGRDELEALICRNAALNLSNESLEKLEELLKEMKNHKENKELLEYSSCNIKFHSIIYSACKNKTAVEMTTHLKEQIKNIIIIKLSLHQVGMKLL